MAKLYNVSTDYLLGNDIQTAVDSLSPIHQEAFPLFHGRPVWVKGYGWALVNSVEKTLLFSDGHKELYTDRTVFTFAPNFAEANLPISKPLSKDEMKNAESVWVELITADELLRNELRGWYTVKDRFVENEFGNRFYFDTYEAKWLAFEK